MILELIIDESGKVSSAQIVRSVPAFDEAALSAARQWEYEVTKVNGQPVKVKLTVPITFSMKLCTSLALAPTAAERWNKGVRPKPARSRAIA